MEFLFGLTWVCLSLGGFLYWLPSKPAPKRLPWSEPRRKLGLLQNRRVPQRAGFFLFGPKKAVKVVGVGFRVGKKCWHFRIYVPCLAWDYLALDNPLVNDCNPGCKSAPMGKPGICLDLLGWIFRL